MIELTYINEDVSERKYFRTWKSLDKFVMSQKLKKYKVQGQSHRGTIIRYTSVLWEDYMVKAFKRLTGEKKV
ncbi:MAG: hypothetical protein EX285_08915 [Thaumarchaeota archaeon]|nr:hypothetical protein [Nitrososphaerota archaeon]